MLRLMQERIKTCGSVSAGDVTPPGRSARSRWAVRVGEQSTMESTKNQFDKHNNHCVYLDNKKAEKSVLVLRL